METVFIGNLIFLIREGDILKESPNRRCGKYAFNGSVKSPNYKNVQSQFISNEKSSNF